MIKYPLIALFLISALYVHYRGRVRFGFTRQVLAFETFFAPLNGFMYLFSAVPHKAYQDLGRFPELRVLKDNWQIFREEAVKLADSGEVKVTRKREDIAFNSFMRRGWKRFYLKWYDRPQPSAEALCPRSVALVQSVPGIKAAMFALLPPGGQLMRHRDPYAGSLRYHLGLVTPNSDACRIYVDGEMYSWRDGEDVLFDETYIHHAANDTDQARIILFCDVERPMRYGFAAAVNRWVSRHLMTAAAARNQAGDQVGGLNRVFHHLYKVRIASRAIKARSSVGYYSLKYLLFGLLAWWIIA